MTHCLWGCGRPVSAGQRICDACARAMVGRIEAAVKDSDRRFGPALAAALDAEQAMYIELVDDVYMAPDTRRTK